VQDALLDTLRFWLERGVDGFRLDTVNYYFHSPTLKDNPPTAESLDGTIGDAGTYLYQQHLYDKTQPENLVFLSRLRTLLDAYGARAIVGEVGDEGRSLETVAAYTAGRERLHMCYTFDMLGPQFSAAHVARCIDAFETEIADGWLCWAFSNHDVVRHVTRWSRPGDAPDSVAKFAIALIACLRGSICLYQGEELGLEEAELRFEDLRDPYGIRFWPGFKGRDGARTPMVWEDGAANAGFSTGKPWLPVPANHLARAAEVEQNDPVSVLSRYRATLAYRRRETALRQGTIHRLEFDGNVLAFVRKEGKRRLLCTFNFGREAAILSLPGSLGALADAAFPGSVDLPSGPSFGLPPLSFLIATLE
ncbi:MAG: alpha-glucosidase, partial [Rhizobiaceae bacterium]|nr:alpha-glucosidase [Rhizobiaceae bacterium]